MSKGLEKMATEQEGFNELEQEIIKRYNITILGTPLAEGIMYKTYRKYLTNRVNYDYIAIDELFNNRLKPRVRRKKMVNKTKFKFVG